MPGRQYWAHSFKVTDSFTERTRPGHGADTDAEAAGDPCSRDVHCAGRRIVTENGERRIIPARTYGPFCVSCRGLIGTCLSELPPAYERLEAEIPEPHRRGHPSLGGTFGPRLPFDASYDLMLRTMSEVLASWTERVRTTARLSVLDTQLSRQRNQRAAVGDYVATLSAHLVVLLALEAGPMMRSVPVRSHVDPDRITMLMLGGQDAGEEILFMHRRALLVLGEIVKQRETLDGVPCRKCEAMALVRAEPPSDPAKEAQWSHCEHCRDELSKSQFDAWAAMYAKWAQNAGTACRRCQLNRHAECTFADCVCLAGEHLNSLVA